jgi:hypothetical protein
MSRSADRTSEEANVRKVVAVLLVALFTLGLASCTSHDSDVASENLSTEADQFHILRRIVFYNGITGEYMLELEGFCALGNNDGPRELTVVCKTGEDEYKKSFLGLSDNVTYFVEQLSSYGVSKDRYKVIFKPSIILPDIDLST